MKNRKSILNPFYAVILTMIGMIGTTMMANTAVAVEENPTLSAIEEYMDFTEYRSSLIWPKQTPEEE